MKITEAIQKVLGDADGPMKAGAIADAVVPLVPGLKGKTPKATVAAKIYTQAKKPDGLVRKEGDGFVLNTSAPVEAKVEGTRKEGESPAAIEGTTVVKDGSKDQAKPDPKPSGRRSTGRKRGAKQGAAA